MKRTNLIVNEDLLKEAKKILEAESFSSTVNKALAMAIQMEKIKGLKDFIGSGVWEGNLAEMRGDSKKVSSTKSKKKKRKK